MTQNTNETVLHIIGTDLLDYSFKVEKAIKEGYTFSDLNMYAPRAWPHMFEAWMLLAQKGSINVEVTVTNNGVSNTDIVEIVKKEVDQTTKQVTRRGKK